MKSNQKLAIHELLNRAAYYFDIHDVDGLKTCFTKDAGMLVKIADGQTFGPFESREAIMELMSASLSAQTDTRRHIICNIFFESEGSKEPTAVSTLVVTSAESGKIGLVTSGVYRDVVKKVDGNWLISHRHLDLDLPF
jgi:hypothetical protein